jgi:hypothetical protein
MTICCFKHAVAMKVACVFLCACVSVCVFVCLCVYVCECACLLAACIYDVCVWVLCVNVLCKYASMQKTFMFAPALCLRICCLTLSFRVHTETQASAPSVYPCSTWSICPCRSSRRCGTGSSPKGCVRSCTYAEGPST